MVSYALIVTIKLLNASSDAIGFSRAKNKKCSRLFWLSDSSGSFSVLNIGDSFYTLSKVLKKSDSSKSLLTTEVPTV